MAVVVGRPRRGREDEVALWVGIRSGLSVDLAAAGVGMSRARAYRWFRERGGVGPRVSVAPAAGRSVRLSFAEREEIAVLSAQAVGVRQIARVLGRAPSTVSRELARVGNGRYRASTAQADADRQALRPKPGRLATRPVLRAEVVARLGKRHSPKQIARRLRAEFPDDPEMWVSHETIYQALYVQSRGELRRELTERLRSGRTLRKPRKPVGQRKERFAGMVMIADRPAEVEDRAVPGHWEGDLILGSAVSGSAVGTLVERTTRFVMLLHLPGGHTADIVQEAMVTKMATLPDHLRRSLTWDQGSEMANHLAIADATGLEIYFCDPHSPWQRGTNENTNGLLRQYLPKGTDLSFYGPGMLDNIATELNGRPRQTLHWATPAEALAELLSPPTNPSGVATTT